MNKMLMKLEWIEDSVGARNYLRLDDPFEMLDFIERLCKGESFYLVGFVQGIHASKGARKTERIADVDFRGTDVDFFTENGSVYRICKSFVEGDTIRFQDILGFRIYYDGDIKTYEAKGDLKREDFFAEVKNLQYLDFSLEVEYMHDDEVKKVKAFNYQQDKGLNFHFTWTSTCAAGAEGGLLRVYH